jgi:hypothetical protein
MKAKMTVYKGGGKAPASGMGKKVVNYKMGGKPPVKPPAKVQGATVVAKKGEGIKTQGFATSDFQQKRDSLMTAGVSDFMKGKPKDYKISAAERSNIKDKVRAELIKGGQQFYAPVFKETGAKLTPTQLADKKRLEEEQRKKSAAGYGVPPVAYKK